MEAPSLEDCGQQVKRVLESPSIPQHHCLLLQKLTRHFYRLCKNNSRNRLTPRILGEAFGEVLFQSPVTSTRVNPEHRVRILESLIVVGGVSEIQTAPGVLTYTSLPILPAYPGFMSEIAMLNTSHICLRGSHS
ncbi:hypothetical protein FKM82_002021 [Ascaphus truei]